MTYQKKTGWTVMCGWFLPSSRCARLSPTSAGFPFLRLSGIRQGSQVLRCALQRYEKSLNIDLKSTLFIGKFAKNSRKQSKTCTFGAKILTMKTKNGWFPAFCIVAWLPAQKATRAEDRAAQMAEGNYRRSKRWNMTFFAWICRFCDVKKAARPHGLVAPIYY